MEKFDYKKEYRDLYQPNQKPAIVTVPEMMFIMIDGKGDPNEENGDYQKAMGLLYALTFTIKMSKMGNQAPEGYFEYVVPPLEGFWWFKDGGDLNFENKDKFCWTSMIRQPEFVTPAVFRWACGEVESKKHLDISKARLEVFTEGLCVQKMHLGSYDDEPASLMQIKKFISENGLQNAIGDTYPDGRIKRHHEIYLSDPRRTTPEKLRTILRHPVKSAE